MNIFIHTHTYISNPILQENLKKKPQIFSNNPGRGPLSKVRGDGPVTRHALLNGSLCIDWSVPADRKIHISVNCLLFKRSSASGLISSLFNSVARAVTRATERDLGTPQRGIYFFHHFSTTCVVAAHARVPQTGEAPARVSSKQWTRVFDGVEYTVGSLEFFESLFFFFFFLLLPTVHKLFPERPTTVEQSLVNR